MSVVGERRERSSAWCERCKIATLQRGVDQGVALASAS
jgi:hypothetical protein